jgi:hypothetical protein
MSIRRDNNFEFSGARISGFSGHRRRESVDYATGRGASGNIPSVVRQVRFYVEREI